MIITLTGDNAFGRQGELSKLVAAFTAKYGGLAVERLDGQEASLQQLAEALTALPFLSPKKLVILRQPAANKQFGEQVEHIFNRVPETTDVIVVEPKLDRRLSYFKFLKSKTDFRDFAELPPAQLPAWLTANAKQQGGSLSATDARFLVERVGNNQQLLANELEKLIIYEPQVSRRSIEALTEPTPQSTIFQLLEAAFGGRTKQVLRLYQEQRALKVEPPQIIAMLSWQLHILAEIKTAGDRSSTDIARDAKLNPYVVNKSQTIARELSLKRLKNLINDLLMIDIKSKRSGIDSDEALQRYLLGLAIS